MLLPITLLLLGLVLLVKGADWLVDGASSIAKQYNVSELAIGLTIVAFGTSMPELVVNATASIQDHHEIVFANVIGSNNFNLFIILGISGLIIPLKVGSGTVWREIPLSLSAAILLYLICNYFPATQAVLTRIEGALLLAVFGLFLVYVYKQLSAEVKRAVESDQPVPPSTKRWILIVIGLAGLIIGGRMVVSNAIQMATAWGVSEKIIGLTIVAAGTSLPELMTSVVAAYRKSIDIAVGNVIGSNIFNILFILSVSALINPIKYDILFNRDLYLLAAGTVFLFIAMFTGQKRKLDRWEAAILLITYVGYTTYLIAEGI